MMNISLLITGAGVLIILSTLGSRNGALFNFWLEHFGEERVKQVLLIGLLLVGLGVAGILIEVIHNCSVHPQGCLAG